MIPFYWVTYFFLLLNISPPPFLAPSSLLPPSYATITRPLPLLPSPLLTPSSLHHILPSPPFLSPSSPPPSYLSPLLPLLTSLLPSSLPLSSPPYLSPLLLLPLLLTSLLSSLPLLLPPSSSSPPPHLPPLLLFTYLLSSFPPLPPLLPPSSPECHPLSYQADPRHGHAHAPHQCRGCGRHGRPWGPARGGHLVQHPAAIPQGQNLCESGVVCWVWCLNLLGVGVSVVEGGGDLMQRLCVCVCVCVCVGMGEWSACGCVG